jgi:predicted HicB family RNase H-like nuclease
MKNEYLNIRVSTPLKRKIVKAAQKDKRSVSSMLNLLLEKEYGK